MKKKNVLLMALSMVLVAVISIGSTLAYLTASDNKVVNSFEFANGITVTLREDQPTATGDETISANSNGGYSYTNVVPGQTLNKAPKFTVTTSVDAYVFARVTPGENMTIGTITNGWTKLDGVETSSGKLVYYKEVKGQAAQRDLGTLFNEVTVGNVNLSGNEPLGSITIEVAAIQKSGLNTPDAAYAQAVSVFQA